MAVVIRLARHGRRNRPFYRIVVADKEMKRDGRFLELVGTLDTLTSPPALTLKEERVKHWVSAGAIPSDTVSQYVEKLIPGYLSSIEAGRLEKVRSRRAKRKARMSGKAAKPAKASKKKAEAKKA